MSDLKSASRILAVDDVAFNLEIVATVFDDVVPGVEVIAETDGQRALDYLRENPGTDVVLLDLVMPGISGYEVLAAIRADERLRRIPVIVITANAEEKKRALALGASDFVTKPFDIEELRLRCLNHIENKKQHDMLRGMQDMLEAEVARRTADLSAALRLAKRNEFEISIRLGRASEYRDSETGAHIVRMSRCSAHLAEIIGLPADAVELILHAAPLHDVGKIGIADAIVRKPDKLTPEEFAAMQQHALIGGAILAEGGSCPVVETGRIIAEQHHEKWDGTGYPRGLSGEQIHLYARLVAICDVFDALISERVYKPALPVEQAVRIMSEERGRHFDPVLLDAFLGAIDEFVAISRELSDRPPTRPAGM
ncbi:MAG: HD domain-containing phosphohydrolase [Deltaproteobacteria bacterium]